MSRFASPKNDDELVRSLTKRSAIERLKGFRRLKALFRKEADSESGSARAGERKAAATRHNTIKQLVNFLYRRGSRRRMALTVVIVVVVSFYVGQQGFSYGDLIIVFSSLILGVIVFKGERGIHYGFVLWVLTLALGYRTIQWTPNLHIHPAEVLLWMLLACVCVQRHLVSSSRLMFPLWIWLLMPFWVFAWWPLILGNAAWDQMLNEFRNFLLLIPLMIVATVVLRQRHNWQWLLLAFLTASTWIAVMGILEFWVSGISHLFPAFMTSANAGTIEGFERASFGFWGGPMATFICALALPLAIVAVRWWSAAWQRALIIASTIAQIIAIYIGGYRSIWLVLVVEMLVACLLCLKRQRVTIAAVSLVVIVGGYQFVPEAGSNRALSAIHALRGHPTDSSARTRINRAEFALDKLIAAPLGNGWSAAGWVHSDFLQVGANLGLLGGLIFFGGYLYTLGRIGRRVLLESRTEGQGDLGIALFLSYISAGGILATQGVEVLPQLVLPVWFVWVLVEVWLRQKAEGKETNPAVATSYPYQLRRFDYPMGLRTDV